MAKWNSRDIAGESEASEYRPVPFDTNFKPHLRHSGSLIMCAAGGAMMRTSALAALAANRFATRQGQVVFLVLALAAVTALAVLDLRLLVPAVISIVTVGEISGRGAQVRREAANERERETQRRNREEQKHEAQRQQDAERRARAEQEREAKRRRQQEAERRARAEQEREAERRRQQAEEEREAERERQRARTTRPEEWWVVLGLSPNASKEQVVDSYRHLIKQYHPDRVAGLAPEFTALAESRTKAINAAYSQALRERR